MQDKPRMYSLPHFLQVVFGPEKKQCISELHIIINGHVNITYNVTSSDRERGEVTYDLSPYISPEDVCSVGAVVYGSNDVGGSLPVNITLGSTYPLLVQPRDNFVLFPSLTGCLPTMTTVPSVFSSQLGMKLSSTSQPTPLPTTSTNGLESSIILVILAGVPSHVANLVAFSNLSSAAVALIVIVLVTVVTSIFIARRFKNGGNHTNTLSKTFTYVFSLQVKSM